MTIQQLRYFLALCQDLNYTRTAGRMYLSRQALRLSIAALENELCGPLFINVRNHLALTEKGQRFRAQAAPVVEQFDRMCAQAYQDIRSPALRLGISVALVPNYLPMLGDVLEQFRQQYPGIPLEAALLSNDAVCAQLQNGTLDAGLVMDLGGCAAGLARTALFANVYYYMFILYFFLTNGHLSYIKLFHISYETLPIGFSGFTADVPWALVTYFSTVLTLAVKLAAPIIAIEFITEICLGVLMKAVPSIHIFALNIQLKVLIGLAAVLIMAQPMSDFIEKLMGIMWQNLYGLLGMMGS